MDDEKRLIERIKNGDAEAKEELIRKYYPRIMNLVEMKLGRDSDQFNDIVHEVILAVFDGINSRFDTNKSVSLGSYIYKITTNKISDYFKEVKKKSQLMKDVEIETLIHTANAEYNLEQRELYQEISQALFSLKKKYRTVLYLRYFEGLSVSQIAEKIKLPPRRASERIHYALRLLKKKLEKK